jgi:hypothetical protein
MSASYINRFHFSAQNVSCAIIDPSTSLLHPPLHVFRIIEKCTLYCTIIFYRFCLPSSHLPFLLTEHDVTPRRSCFIVSPPLGLGGRLETSHITGPFVGQDYVLLEERGHGVPFRLKLLTSFLDTVLPPLRLGGVKFICILNIFSSCVCAF